MANPMDGLVPFLSLDERKHAHPDHSFIINGYTRDTKCYHSALLVSTDHTCGLEVALQSVISSSLHVKRRYLSSVFVFHPIFIFSILACCDDGEPSDYQHLEMREER